MEHIRKQKQVILFDGVCNLCNSSVQYIIKHDPDHKFKFAALQSEVATSFLANQPKAYSSLDTILLITSTKIYTKSSAALRIGMQFGFFWKLLGVFFIFPKFFRDFFYDIIAKNRYKWYGKKETCMIPSKNLTDRFIMPV